jgi:hypothetical protein
VPARTVAGPTPVAEREWTNTWFVRPAECAQPLAPLSRASTGAWAKAVCGSVDRLDPCDGAPFCGHLNTRVVKDPAVPTARFAVSAAVVFDGTEQAITGPRHAFRCVSTTNQLTRSLRIPGPAPLPRPADPAPPTTDELTAFRAITEDLVDVPPCEKAGRSFIDCRDPRSYLKTNEPKTGVVLPALLNRGGGYTGVASDQNYTFVAHARAQWVWLFDYDANVVRWHHVLRALVLAAADRKAFVAFFTPAGRTSGEAAIAAHADPAERATLSALYRHASANLKSYYERQAFNKAYQYTWIGNDGSFSYIKRLYEQGRMAAFKGNMLESGTMISIGKAARALHVPIRIYYPSNAPEFWEFTDQYRKNVQGLPFDEQSIVVQTISGLSLKTGFGQSGYWHYNVQDGRAHQALLARPGFTRLKQVLFHRTRSDSSELTWSALPAASTATGAATGGASGAPR